MAVDAEEGERDHQQHRAECGPLEGAAQAFERAAAPGDERTYAGQEKQKQADRNINAIEKRTVDGNLVAGDRFGDNREERAPEDGEAACQQDKIVEQEARFTRYNALERSFAFEIGQAVEDEIDDCGYANG